MVWVPTCTIPILGISVPRHHNQPINTYGRLRKSATAPPVAAITSNVLIAAFPTGISRGYGYDAARRAGQNVFAMYSTYQIDALAKRSDKGMRMVDATVPPSRCARKVTTLDAAESRNPRVGTTRIHGRTARLQAATNTSARAVKKAPIGAGSVRADFASSDLELGNEMQAPVEQYGERPWIQRELGCQA